MKKYCSGMNWWLRTVITLFFFAPVTSAEITLPNSESCASASCHSDFLDGTGTHPAMNDQHDCGGCHVADHPEQHEFRFASSGGEMCTGCHDDPIQHDYQHSPAKLGLCTYCHSTHRSEFDGQLKMPLAALCLSCHSDEIPERAKTVHGPVEEGRCTACHNPHGSAVDDHLVADVPQLCFGCHNEDQQDHEGGVLPAVEQTFVDKSLDQHPPFARGDCLLCHEPHASDNIRLQKWPYSQAFYTDYSSDSYFCLMCHGESTFSEPRTLTATKFRNGNLNLHYRHVNRDKGRGCRACHHQHASSLEAQIATETYFGKRNVGIKSFSKTDTGGTCAPSCHQAVKYDRATPFDVAFMVTPRGGEEATPAELKEALGEQSGKTLYLQRCAGCHGPDAEGKIGPPIRGATVERVVAATERVDLMADLASLDAEDLHAIVESLPAGTPIVALPAGASDGEALFSTNCAGCHGPDANGRVGPAIRGAADTTIKEAIDRVPMMVAMKSLDEESLEVISEYLRELDEGIAEGADDARVSAADGKIVYSMNCLGCHGADAHGQIGPSVVGRSESDIKDAIGRVPMMAGLKTLQSADIVAVGDYLTSLGPVADGDELMADGEAVFATSCAACHGADASGHVGPNIRGQTRDDILAAIERVPMMVGVKSLAEAQVSAVGEFISGLGPPESATAATASPAGEAVFVQHCAACHGEDARGRIGPDITLASMDDITSAVDRVPMMIAVKVLGAKDLLAAADYLSEIRESSRPSKDD